MEFLGRRGGVLPNNSWGGGGDWWDSILGGGGGVPLPPLSYPDGKVKDRAVPAGP